MGGALAQTLRALQLEGRSAQGLLDGAIATWAGSARWCSCVSDFHLPLPEVEAVLASMAHHELVPVVLWDPLEFGLTRATRAGAGGRPGNRRQRSWCGGVRRCASKWLAAQRQRREALLRIFRAHRLKPLFIEGGFDADAVTRHFHS